MLLSNFSKIFDSLNLGDVMITFISLLVMGIFWILKIVLFKKVAWIEPVAFVVLMVLYLFVGSKYEALNNVITILVVLDAVYCIYDYVMLALKHDYIVRDANVEVYPKLKK